MVACRFIGSAPYLWTLDLGFKTLDFDLVLTINNFLHPFRSIIAQYIIVKWELQMYIQANGGKLRKEDWRNSLVVDCGKNMLAPEGEPLHQIVEDFADNPNTWFKVSWTKNVQTQVFLRVS